MEESRRASPSSDQEDAVSEEPIVSPDGRIAYPISIPRGTEVYVVGVRHPHGG